MYGNGSSIGLAIVLGVLLTACGGGGGDGGTTVVPPAPPPAGAMSAAELQLATDALTAINDHRVSKGLTPYVWYALGADVAYAHCIRMQAGAFFAHVDPGTNTDPATRALNAGITHAPQGSIDPHSGNPFVGENIAAATGTPSVTYTGLQAVTSWLGSPGHHTQIDAPLTVPGAQVMPAWTHCGIGVRQTTTQIWYTAMFFRTPTP